MNPSKSISETEAFALAKQGDARGLESIYKKYFLSLTNLIQRMGNYSQDDVSEFYQATILIFWENTQSGKIDKLEGRLINYLYAIAKNLVLQDIRRRAREKPTRSDPDVLADVHAQLALTGEEKVRLVSKLLKVSASKANAIILEDVSQLMTKEDLQLDMENEEFASGYLQKSLDSEMQGNFVSEPQVAYQSQNVFRSSAFENIHRARVGISNDELLELMRDVELDDDQFAKILRMPLAGFRAMKKANRLDVRISEQVIEFMQIVRLGKEVFGDKSLFNSWFKSPSIALGNSSPLSLLDTVFGRDEVKKELGRVAHGVY